MGYRTPNCALLICCFNDSVSLFTQYQVNSNSESIPCFYSGATLLLGMIHSKQSLHACIHCIFTHGFGIVCTFYNVLEKLVNGSGLFYQISRLVVVQLLPLVYFGVPSLIFASKVSSVFKIPDDIIFAVKVVVVVGYPTPSEGWGHGRRPWSPRSWATPTAWTRDCRETRESPKSERRKESVARQCRMK